MELTPTKLMELIYSLSKQESVITFLHTGIRTILPEVRSVLHYVVKNGSAQRSSFITAHLPRGSVLGAMHYLM